MDYEKMLSKNITSIKPSGIRRFFDIANEMEDVISLGVGEPDFKTPWEIRQAGIMSLQNGKTWYTANAGLPTLKKEITKFLDRKYNLKYNPKDEVLVTVGGSEAIDMCIRAIVDPGDEVIVIEPCFVCYTPIAKLCGAKVVHLQTKPEDSFRLTAKNLLAHITDKTKLIIFPFPNNPTGAVMRKEHLREIVDVLKDKDILVLSDEIYSELTYGEKHVSIAEFDEMKDKTIVVNGFSKSYAMTGWRLGYAVGPKPIIEQMTKIHQFAIMCAPSTSQYAAITALKNCEEQIDEMVTEYNMRRKLIVEGFNNLGLTCFDPQGAFYVFPSIKKTGLSSEEFCQKLLYSQHVAIIPGTAFGDCGEGFARVSYSYSIKHILEALRRIEEFLKTL